VIRLISVVRARTLWTRRPYALTLPSRTNNIRVRTNGISSGLYPLSRTMLTMIVLSNYTPPPPSPLALLLMNGTNGSTTFADEAGSSWTNSGSAVISTTESKFGESSGYFSGSGCQISKTNAGFAVGTGDFTVQGWIYAESSGRDRCLYNFGIGAVHGVYIWSNNLGVYDGAELRAQISSGAAVGVAVDNIWLHWAACRKNGVLTCYWEGVGSSSPFSSSTDYNATTHYIGADSGGTDRVDGYLDAVSFWDIALYDGDFAPPTTEPEMP
jgi:hypothetical protein